jgi:hypothetical protein
MKAPLRIAVALLFTGSLFALGLANYSLRRQLDARQTELTLLNLEMRQLRQQLEAERILAAGQARLLQQHAPGTPASSE